MVENDLRLYILSFYKLFLSQTIGTITISLGNTMKLNKVTSGVFIALSASFLTSQVNAEDAQQQVETIVVTGQKIDRTIKETPTSVAVITTEELESANVQNITDVFSGMANVSGDIAQGFHIRGIDAFNVSGGGNSYLATMYVDGAPLPYRVVRSGALPVWDLAQVEVFRGPQSTLQGRNALAGAVHIRTQDPTYDWTGKGKITLGNLGQQEFAVAGGGGLIEDMLALRVSIEDKRLDGDIDNITRNEESNYEESSTARAKILFEPTEDFKAMLSIANTKSELGPQWVLYDFGDSPYDRETDYNSHIYNTTDTDIITLEMDYNINDEMSLVSVFTSNDSEYRYNWDGDLTPEQITKDNKYKRVDKTTSQEVRFTYDGDELEAVIGVYFSNVDGNGRSEGERHIVIENAIGYDLATAVTGFLMGYGYDAQTAAGLAAQVVPLYPDIDPIILSFTTDVEQKIKSQALFADFKYSVNDSFDILAGFRFDNEEQKNLANNNNYTIANNMPNPTNFDANTGQIISGINAYLNSFAQAASGVEPPSSADFDAFLPKLGVSYHINEDVTTSFIFQRGFRSGGVGTNTAENYLYTYDAEYTDNYELSLRSVWLGGELMVNANFFMTDWTDMQVQNQLSTRQYDIVTQNAGKAEIKGFELEAFYYPTDSLSVIAGVGLAKSEFKDYQYVNPRYNANDPDSNEFVDLSGRAFADAPEWTANMSVNYDFESGLFLNVNANYQNEAVAFLDPERSIGLVGVDPTNDARTLVNAQLGYNFGRYLVRLDARNLLDKDYIATYFDNARDSNESDAYGQHQIGRSRQISLTVQADF